MNEIDVAEYLLYNPELVSVAKENCSFTMGYEMFNDEYNSCLVYSIINELKKYFRDYDKLLEIVDKPFLVKILGQEYFK